MFNPLSIPFGCVMLYNVVKVKEGVSEEDVQLAPHAADYTDGFPEIHLRMSGRMMQRHELLRRELGPVPVSPRVPRRSIPGTYPG